MDDKRRIVSKLNKYKRDLTDDNGDIRSINMRTDDIIDHFLRAVVSDNTSSVVDKLEDLREPFEHNDKNISRACNEIEQEIDTLEAEIAREEAKEAAAKSGSK